MRHGAGRNVLALRPTYASAVVGLPLQRSALNQPRLLQPPWQFERPWLLQRPMPFNGEAGGPRLSDRIHRFAPPPGSNRSTIVSVATAGPAPGLPSGRGTIGDPFVLPEETVRPRRGPLPVWALLAAGALFVLFMIRR